MTSRSSNRCVALLVALGMTSASAQAQRVVRPAGVIAAGTLRDSARIAVSPLLTHGRPGADDDDAPIPAWLKWGLVGGVAGAVALPLLSGLSGRQTSPAQDAVIGAVGGSVIVAGSVSAWQMPCGPGSASRRAGLCGSEPTLPRPR